MQATRIVSRARGSWKWQDAFGLSFYEPKVLRNGKTVWVSVSSYGKFSAPQLRRLGYGEHPHGSLHMVPLTRDEADAFAAGL